MSDEGRFTARERWLFDLNGFVVVDDALAPSKCDDLNALLDTEIEGVPASLCCHCPVDVSVPVEVLGGEEGFSGGQAGEKGHTHRFGDFLDPGRPLHAEFLRLIDNRRVAPYLDALFSNAHIAEGDERAASFRIDHVYLDVIAPPAPAAGSSTDGPIGTTLHKLGLPDAYYHYEGGKMYNGLLTVAYNLHDVDPAIGGFACIPGSVSLQPAITRHAARPLLLILSSQLTDLLPFIFPTHSTRVR